MPDSTLDLQHHQNGGNSPAKRFSLCIAQSEEDMHAVQALRYQVFFTECHAQAKTSSHRQGRDYDHYDDYCTHLMVIDHHKDDQLAAYTRLLLSDNLPDGLGFIAEDEFSIPLLDKFTTQSMEIGRTCVHPDYRDGQAIQMLWQGITKFVFDHNILFLFGCASFHETNPDQIANQLTYLHKYHLADEENRARSLDYIPLARLPDDQIERRSALAQMPPLVKAYLQLGGVVGDGCFLDQDFKTLDVLVTVEISKVPQQYSKYFKKLANRLTFASPNMRKQ